MSEFNGATLMIIGGTGSFGNTVLKHFLETYIGQIRIFSRDEKNRMIFAMNYKRSIPIMQRRSSFMWVMSVILAPLLMRYLA